MDDDELIAPMAGGDDGALRDDRRPLGRPEWFTSGASVTEQQWGAAGIYPTAASPQLAITSQQAAQLTLFAA